LEEDDVLVYGIASPADLRPKEFERNKDEESEQLSDEGQDNEDIDEAHDA